MLLAYSIINFVFGGFWLLICVLDLFSEYPQDGTVQEVLFLAILMLIMILLLKVRNKLIPALILLMFSIVSLFLTNYGANFASGSSMGGLMFQGLYLLIMTVWLPVPAILMLIFNKKISTQ